MNGKSSRRLRRLRKNGMVDKAMEKRVQRLFPYGRP
jgi:large subunit ribosomal protein L35